MPHFTFLVCRSLMSSSRQGPTQISPSKGRSKLEALDTLVISTIHNVSNKLCSSSAGVLRQAAAVFPEQDEEQVRSLRDGLSNGSCFLYFRPQLWRRSSTC